MMLVQSEFWVTKYSNAMGFEVMQAKCREADWLAKHVCNEYAHRAEIFI